MDHVASALAAALCAAYRPYLAKVSATHDIESEVAEGEAWLAAELEDLLSLPFVQQRRGPLELFQEALRFPTAGLAQLGVPAPKRSAAESTALPGDAYGLAPASSQDLGEEAWQAHIAWGAVKAGALTTVCWFGRDLTDRSKVEAAVSAADRRLAITPGDLSGCGTVVIDLDYPDAADLISEASEGGWRTVAYGPHVDRDRLGEATAMGATAVSRSKFFTDPGLFLG